MSDDFSGWGEDDQQDFEIDLAGVSTDDVAEGSDLVGREGAYHLKIVKVVPDLDTLNANGNPKTPSVRFDLEVMHSVKGQCPKGSKHFHKLYVGSKNGGGPSQGSIANICRWLEGLGYLKRSDGAFIDVTTGKPPKLGAAFLARCEGDHLIAKVKFKKGENGFPDGYEIPFCRVARLDDPAVGHIPRDVAAYEADTGRKLTEKPVKEETPAEPVAAAAGNNEPTDELDDL